LNIINLGILAHVDAGKTTLTESILYHAGIIKNKGRVDDGNTISDSMSLERERGMSIRSSTVSFTYNNVKFNLVDTPGHMDFIGEVERSLVVLDLAILVISAKEGIQPQTRVIFRKLQELKIPIIIFINKIDRLGVNLFNLYKDINIQLNKNAIVMQDVMGVDEYDIPHKEYVLKEMSFNSSRIQENLLNSSEILLENYVDNQVIDEISYENEFIRMFLKGELYPIYHGIALRDIGTNNLLDVCIRYFNKKRDSLTDLSAYVYKVEWDEKGHKKIYIRLFNGIIYLKKQVSIVGFDYPILVSTLKKVEDGKVLYADYLEAGDIGMLLDMKELRVGDVLGVPIESVSYELAKPLLAVSVMPNEDSKRSTLILSLQQLTAEDPHLEVMILPLTGEIRLKLFGKLQMEVLTTVLKERYDLDVTFSDMITVYKEQPIGKVQASIWRGDPGNLLSAGIVFTIEPLELGSGYAYENQVSYGYLEKPFQNAVLEGIKIGLSEGIHDKEIIDVKVTFVDAYYDSVCGTPSDFRKLAPIVIKKGLEEVGVKELEPWQNYQIIAPLGYEKIVTSDIVKMKGTINEMTYSESEFKIDGIIPYDTSKDYGVNLLTVTEGKGIFQTKFYKYLPK
jgi:ribosomal protection tetracycline resistance protein